MLPGGKRYERSYPHIPGTYSLGGRRGNTITINISALAEFLCQCPVRHAQEAYSTFSSLPFVSSTVLTKALQIHFCWSYLNSLKCDQAKKENFSELKNRLLGTSLIITKSLKLYLWKYEQCFLRFFSSLYHINKVSLPYLKHSDKFFLKNIWFLNMFTTTFLKFLDYNDTLFVFYWTHLKKRGLEEIFI